MISDILFLSIRAKSKWQKTAAKKRIGFIRPRFPLYSFAMASTRIRVYDPILWFVNDADYILELFNPRRKYNVVIFQKYFDDAALALAKRLKEQGTVIVLDMNVNFYATHSAFVPDEQRAQVQQFTEFVDYVIVASPYLQEVVEKHFPNKPVALIEEAIPEKFFKKKMVPNNPPKRLLWVGFKWKVKELESLRTTLSALATQFGIELRTIGGTDLNLGEMRVDRQPYREWSVQEKMRGCDIFIAPRDLSDPYNLAHTFTKIGGAMAMGIPVVASPVPSYQSSPALLCETEGDWRKTLTALAAGEYNLNELSQRGTSYVWQHYRPEKIKADYRCFFDELCTV